MNRAAMTSKIMKAAIIVPILALMYCGNRAAVNERSALILSHSAVDELISLLGPYQNSQFDFRLYYIEQFNDSTCAVRVYLNDKAHLSDSTFCDHFKYFKNDVFIYNSPNCSISEDISTSQNGPSYPSNGILWQVLVKKREQHFEFYNITFLNNPDDPSLKDLDSIPY